MRRILNLLACALAISTVVVAQPSGIELKNGTGTVISQHNSITAAYNAIPTTLTQAYIIEITPAYTGATETYPIIFIAKTGASAVNTITLRPAAGITGVSISTTLAAGSMFQLNDADYVIIDGRAGGTGTARALTFNNSGTTSNSNTIQLINGACNNIIRYCTVNNGTTGSAGRGIHFSTSASNTSGNSDNLIEFCTVNSGRYTINSSGTAANKNARNRIYGCDVVNIIFAGFWGQAGTGTVIIDSNRFYCTTASGDTPYGIIFDSQTDTAIMSRNRIYDLDHGTATGLAKAIAIRSVTGTNYSLIYNNFIALSSPNTGCTALMGIEYAGSALTNADIYFNTVRVQGTLTGGTAGNVVSAAFNKTATNASSVYNIRNNIFINERTGGSAGVQHLAASLGSTAGIINADHNTYGSASGELIRLGTTVFNTMASYQPVVAPNDANANVAAVLFTSVTDLHLSGTSIGNTALQGSPVTLQAPLTGITSDIDNDLRSATAPYRGADEGAVAPCLAPSGLNATGITQNSANISWNAVAGATGYQYAVITSATPPANGNLLIPATQSIAGLLPATTYYVHVRVQCGPSDFSPWVTIPFTTSIPPICVDPAPVGFSNITTTSADITWNNSSGAVGYQYAITTQTVPPNTGNSTTATTIHESGLTPGTTYFAHVRSVCSGGLMSVWISRPFSTLTPPCPQPAPSVSNVTTSGADISWPAVTGAVGYEYALTNSPMPPVLGSNTTLISQSIAGLMDNTTYYLHVRTNCGAGGYSNWATVSFTTAAYCSAPTAIFSNITAKSADINWNAVTGAGSYEYVLGTGIAIPADTGTGTTGVNYNAIDLLPSTHYYMHMRSICGVDASTWSTSGFVTMAVTGISDLGDDIGLQLYPNPAKDYLTISAGAEIKEVQVYNAVGAMVLRQELKGNKVTIQTARLSIGMYIIKINTEKGSAKEQFAIIR